MDWTGCNLIEQVPGKVSGRPVIRGSQIEPHVVLVDEKCGRTPEQTYQSFPTIPGGVDTIKKIRAFAIEQAALGSFTKVDCGRVQSQGAFYKLHLTRLILRRHAVRMGQQAEEAWAR